jgi:hypothetical protein
MTHHVGFTVLVPHKPSWRGQEYLYLLYMSRSSKWSPSFSHNNIKEDPGINGKIMYNVMLQIYVSVTVCDTGVQFYVKQYIGWLLVRFPLFASNLHNPELLFTEGPWKRKLAACSQNSNIETGSTRATEFFS